MNLLLAYYANTLKGCRHKCMHASLGLIVSSVTSNAHLLAGSQLKRRKIMLAIVLLSFSIGTVFFAISMLVFYPTIWPSYTSSPVPESAEYPYGFLFFTSEDIILASPSSLLFRIDGLNYQEGIVSVHVFADLIRSMAKTTEGNSTFFVLQVFQKISNVSITVNGHSPEDYGKKESILPYERSATSYLLIDIPKENFTDVGDRIKVSIDFTWKGVFWRQSFYKYNLVVSFNTNFPNYINEVGLPNEAINVNGLLIPDVTSRTMLSIIRPEAAVISEAMPNPDVMTFYGGKVWCVWDVKSRSDRDRYASTAVSVDVEVDELKKEYESSWAYFTLCLGIGVPLMVSSFFEGLKLHYSKYAEISNKQASCALMETKRVVHHKDNTFSFISNSKKIRVELNEAGIRSVGGLEQLSRFIKEIQSGKRKVRISKKAVEALERYAFAEALFQS
jgi:hypothetical protein